MANEKSGTQTADIETLKEVLELAREQLESKGKSKKEKLHIEAMKQTLTLATSGFGLVAALAWNNLIQEFVGSYIKKYVPGNAGIFSLLIYALIITMIAVFVTFQLSKLIKRLEDK